MNNNTKHKQCTRYSVSHLEEGYVLHATLFLNKWIESITNEF